MDGSSGEPHSATPHEVGVLLKPAAAQIDADDPRSEPLRVTLQLWADDLDPLASGDSARAEDPV